MEMGSLNYSDLDEKLQAILDEAESNGWKCCITKEDGGRTYVDLSKYSPAGEDFGMTVDFEEGRQAESFMEELKSHVEDFDPEEHAEMFIPSRGERGVPSSIRELLDDADAIKVMVMELYDALEGCAA